MSEKYTHLSVEVRVERLRAHLLQRETELFDNELNITANKALVARKPASDTQAAIKKMEVVSFNLRVGLEVMRAELIALEEQEDGIERIPTGRHREAVEA